MAKQEVVKTRSVFEIDRSDEEQGVLARFSGPDSYISIGLSPRAIADIKQLDQRLKRARARSKDFPVG